MKRFLKGFVLLSLAVIIGVILPFQLTRSSVKTVNVPVLTKAVQRGDKLDGVLKTIEAGTYNKPAAMVTDMEHSCNEQN